MAVPTARRFTSDALRAWRVTEPTRETTELVVSELVGNAVQHGAGGAELSLTLHEDVVRIEVADHSPDVPVVVSPELDGDRHRGLLIVAALSVRWGTEPIGAGKIVWAELPSVLDIGPVPRPPADDRTLSG
jgi:anti-sigma regulatory factor (Ser/Thr protein kinase)